MRGSYWGQKSYAAIQVALAKASQEKLDEKATRRLVADAYPFGERRHWPYKVWLRVQKMLLREWFRFGNAPQSTPDPTESEWFGPRGPRRCLDPRCHATEHLVEEDGVLFCPKHSTKNMGVADAL
jgi:hypothetical protein